MVYAPERKHWDILIMGLTSDDLHTCSSTRMYSWHLRTSTLYILQKSKGNTYMAYVTYYRKVNTNMVYVTYYWKANKNLEYAMYYGKGNTNMVYATC